MSRTFASRTLNGSGALGPIANVRGGDGHAALGTSEKKPYPKESALIDLVAAERMEGRPMLVYATHTGTSDRALQTHRRCSWRRW